MSNVKRVVDEFGTWELQPGGGMRLIEESQEWSDKRRTMSENQPEPTQEEYMMDLDYRLSLIELGL